MFRVLSFVVRFLNSIGKFLKLVISSKFFDEIDLLEVKKELSLLTFDAKYPYWKKCPSSDNVNQWFSYPNLGKIILQDIKENILFYLSNLLRTKYYRAEYYFCLI